MRILKPFYFILIVSLIFSCSSSEEEVKLDLSNFTFTVSNTKLTSATIKYTGWYQGETATILYKEKNTTENYQSVSVNNSETVLSDLSKATAYEVKYIISNNNSSIESDTKYFTTKAVDFDYEKFYSENDGEFRNAVLVFSHLNKQHIIHAAGLSDYNNVELYLVNEEKTDSLQLATTIVSDSITFTIPNNYLQQTPRESVKKAWLGIKIKDSYEYLFNYSAWVNKLSNPNYSPNDDPNESYLKLKIFNSEPFISKISLLTGSSSCPNYTKLNFTGDFLGFWDYYYWTPTQAELVIFDSNGSIYRSYTSPYNSGPAHTCDNFRVLLSNNILEEGILNYHQRGAAQVNMPNLAIGNYTAKIIFTFNNGESIETNTVNFTKE